MKKLLIVFTVIILVLIGSIYIFIPAQIIISKVKIFSCTRDAAARIMGKKEIWNHLFLKSSATDSMSFKYNKDTFRIIQSSLIAVEINVQYTDNNTYKTQILFIPAPRDSLIMQWKCIFESSGYNPVKRMINYYKGEKLLSEMNDILSRIKVFLDVPENVYGMKIIETSTLDTLLIATKFRFKNYPSTNDIYTIINSLKDFAIKNNSNISGYPMINISETNNNTYDLMAALPTHKEPPANGVFFIRRMVQGNFMTAEIKGDTQKVKEAIDQMQFYCSDYHKTTMAIPFQYLITDRTKEKDSTKWVTRIFAPVMR